MWLVALAIAALVVYIGSLKAARAGRPHARAANVSAALGLAVLAGIVGSLGLVLHEFRCDDGCVDRAHYPQYGWDAYLDSWQWDLQLWLALGGFAAAALVVWWTLRSRYPRALAALGVGVASCGLWAALIVSAYS